MLNRFKELEVFLKAGKIGYEMCFNNFAQKTNHFRDIYINVWNRFRKIVVKQKKNM